MKGWRSFLERAGEGLNENGVCGKVSKATGFPEGHYSSNPAIPPYLIETSLLHSAPEHCETENSLRTIISGPTWLSRRKTQSGPFRCPDVWRAYPPHLFDLGVGQSDDTFGCIVTVHRP